LFEAVGSPRWPSDGEIIAIRQDGTTEGSISVSGNTVTYGAFTGAHYGWSEEKLNKGMLVSLTGQNRNLHGNTSSEIIYGIQSVSGPNDPSVIGAFLSQLEPDQAPGPDNPQLVMAVGNGQMWIADNGEDIEIGDYLISSAVPGHAMKDRGDFDVAHIVARAAEPVRWSEVTESSGGTKHCLVSVFFESFDRSHVSERTVEEMKIQLEELRKQLKSQNEEMQKRLVRLESRMQPTHHTISAAANGK